MKSKTTIISSLYWYIELVYRKETNETPRLRMSSTQISPFLSKPHLFCIVHEIAKKKLVEKNLERESESR